VNTTSLYRKFQRKEAEIKKILAKTLKKLAIFIGFDKLCLLFFAREIRGGGIYNFNEGITYYSILVGLLKTGEFHPPQIFTCLYYQSAITSIGYALLILTIVEVLIFRRSDNMLKYRNIIILGVLGIGILIISPFLIQIIRPLWITALQNNHVIRIMLYGFLVGDTQAMLPFLGFGFIGAVFGLAFEMHIPWKPILIGGVILLLLSFAIGGIGYAIYGEPPYETIIQTPPGRTMCLMVGFMIISILPIYYFESHPRPNHAQNKVAKFLQRFGQNSLTLYLIEGIVAELIIYLIRLIFPLWTSNIYLLAGFGAFVIIMWHFILRSWEKVDYAGSFEWIVQKAAK
jgi:hypothetical protein